MHAWVSVCIVPQCRDHTCMEPFTYRHHSLYVSCLKAETTHAFNFIHTGITLCMYIVASSRNHTRIELLTYRHHFSVCMCLKKAHKHQKYLHTELPSLCIQKHNSCATYWASANLFWLVAWAASNLKGSKMPMQTGALFCLGSSSLQFKTPKSWGKQEPYFAL
jgi:hypothetical protein